MKNLIFSHFIFLAVTLFAPQLAVAQGTVYVSSLSPSSTSSLPVGSDYWLAAGFETGNNASGYDLNSIQLGMADTSGNPSGFTVMIYSAIFGLGINPGSSLGTLNGSLNPSTAGIYTYTDDSNLILSPNTLYFIVLTAGTTVANGAYNWSDSAFPPNSSGGWGDDNAVLHSSNGTSGWTSNPSPYSYSGIAQFAITATPIPEPSLSLLLLLGSGVFIYVRRVFHR
jgi:hypothetical protein